MTVRAPEQRTIDVDVQDVDTRGRTLHGYAAVYGAEADLGDFRERVAPGAFADVLADADVRALLNHDPNEVLGRTRAGTLAWPTRSAGCASRSTCPTSPLGENVREAVARGDIDGASFRFVVGDEDWDGELRTVKTVRELHDISVATYGAYPAASVELRTRPPAAPNDQENDVTDTDNQQPPEEPAARGGLQVEERAETTRKPAGLAAQFRAAGFPGETATIGYPEFRAATWTGDADDLNPTRVQGVALGHDQRYAYPAFGQVAVDAGQTAVQILRQSARTLASASDVIRDIDAVTAKPETDSVLEVAPVSLSAGRLDPDRHPKRLPRAAAVQHGCRRRPAARCERGPGQARPR